MEEKNRQLDECSWNNLGYGRTVITVDILNCSRNSELARICKKIIRNPKFKLGQQKCKTNQKELQIRKTNGICKKSKCSQESESEKNIEWSDQSQSTSIDTKMPTVGSKNSSTFIIGVGSFPGINIFFFHVWQSPEAVN